jgi:hypothetical protein
MTVSRHGQGINRVKNMMRNSSHKIAVSIGLLIGIVAFPFAADNVYDYCGYDRFCADNILLLFLMSAAVTAPVAGGIGYLIFIFLNRKSEGNISE